MSEHMSEHMSKDMLKHVSEHMSKHMSEHVSEHVSEHMSKHMSNIQTLARVAVELRDHWCIDTADSKRLRVLTFYAAQVAQHMPQPHA